MQKSLFDLIVSLVIFAIILIFFILGNKKIIQYIFRDKIADNPFINWLYIVFSIVLVYATILLLLFK